MAAGHVSENTPFYLYDQVHCGFTLILMMSLGEADFSTSETDICRWKVKLIARSAHNNHGFLCLLTNISR